MISTIWTDRFIADKQREQDHRSPFQRDRGRILHSEAFRCLQAKTQIHAVGEDDFYRTRLTHSLEVAQIGSSLRARLFDFLPELSPLLPSRSLIESLCFAHDIGHPPFGHGGEMALNFKMRDHGGFEGNAQSFRIVTRLEPYTENTGMNLTRRTLLGMIKYPALLEHTLPPKPKAIPTTRFINLHDFPTNKGIYHADKTSFDWVLAPLSDTDRQLFTAITPDRDPQKPSHTRYKSLDCSIMELADDIAYGVHDLEDAIVGGMITPQSWQKAEADLANCHSSWIQKNLSEISQKLFSQHRYERKDVIGGLVNYFVTNVRWKEQPEFAEPLLRYNAELPPEIQQVLDVLKTFVFDYVICDAVTQRVEYKGQRILMDMFDMLSCDPPRLLPKPISLRWQASIDTARPRVICDYLASMSDGQAFKLYSSL